MRRNPQQLGAAFLTSLYGGTGGLSQATCRCEGIFLCQGAACTMRLCQSSKCLQVEVVRRSWLMAAAARKLLKQKRARQDTRALGAA